ncbi:MAG: tetratricopeptide repeat protein, partial [Gammaproteobacteria bacterium]|nr:tetratricopeptide repeat protein [Gammaproteobacteria bacterium]
MGYIALSQSRTDLALECFHQALKRNPYHGTLLSQVGSIYLKKADYQKASEYFQRVEKGGAFTPTNNINMARSYIGLKQWRMALSYLERINDESILTAYIHYLTGLCYQALQENVLAISEYNTAYQKDRRYIVPLLEFYQSLNDWESINKFAGEHLERFQDQAYAIELIAMAEEQLNKIENAASLFTRAAIQYYQMNDVENASACIAKSLSLSPNNSQVLCDAGAFYYQIKKLKHAHNYLSQALVLEPDSYLIHYNLGCVEKDLGQQQAAATYFENALQIKPNFVPAISRLAGVYADLNCIEKALEFYDLALSIQADDAFSHYNKSLLLLANGQFHQAWQGYEWRIKQDCDTDYLANPLDTNQVLPRPSTIDIAQLKDKKVLLVNDQGLGDLLFFARYLNAIQQFGVETDLIIPEKLQPLLHRCSRQLNIAPFNAEQNYEAIFSICDLPVILPDSHKKPPEPATLTACAETRLKVEMDLLSKGRPPFLAVSWQGGIEPEAGTETLYKHVAP